MRQKINFQNRARLLALNFLLISSSLFSQAPQKYTWDKIAFPVITIKDSVLINELAQEFLIALDSSVQHLALVDLNFDGPGIKDIIIVYPSYEIHFLDLMTDKAARMMREWPPYNIRSMILADGSVLADLDSIKIPYLPIIKELHQNIQRLYGTQPIKVFYSRKEEGIQFEILHLDSSALKSFAP